MIPFDALMPRALFSLATAFAVSLMVGSKMIRWFLQKQIGQYVRTVGPKSHYEKGGTPTMGGALVLFATAASTLLWANWHNRYVWVLLFTLMGFGLIGWIDDYRKVIQKNNKGLPGRWKYCAQSVLGVAIVAYLVSPEYTALFIPFLRTTLPLGMLLYGLLGYFVIVGASNAVNLTDGLDGLAILPVILAAAGLSVFAYIASCPGLTDYFHIPFVAGAEELVIVGAALVGAGLGFLWFNAYPAQVFMGDVGSLALGAVLGVMAFIIHQELVLFFMGFIFVIETVSVILQVASFKTRGGKRIFRMTPIHHHFELAGLHENRVTVRFWVLSILFMILGLSTLLSGSVS
jgi:phospho-N-acetylmuramoyl-pentapeptide-transferase